MMMIVILASVLTMVKDGLTILLACAVIAGSALSVYLLLLAAASLRRPRQAEGRGAPTTRFAVLIPAHEEELVIGQLLDSVNSLDYPHSLFEVHVIADHCSDRTAAIARSLGATVHERNDPEPRGKSRSLQGLVQHLLVCKPGNAIDAFVVLDADSIISHNFLRVMDARLRSGNPLIQGRIQIDDPGSDRIGQLRALAYEFISHLRPLGRSALGLSVGLRGNGMCIARDCAVRFPWDSDSLTEDYELHGRLLAAGLHVTFAPDAIVRTQLPQSLAVARTQSERWERGRLDAMRHHVPALLGHGLRQRAWASIDGAIELIIPPFSVLIALMVALLGLSLLSGIVPLIVVALIGFIAQCLYTLRGLALASARYRHIHRALFFVPAFVVWRAMLYLAVLTRRRPVQWTPTVRTPATSQGSRPGISVLRPSATTRERPGSAKSAKCSERRQPEYSQVRQSRICIIRHYYYPEDPRSRREAEALASAGHHVDILTLRHTGEPAHEVINGVYVRRLPVEHYRGSFLHYAYEYGAFFLLSFLTLAARFVRRRYDVVQVNSLPDFLVFAAAPAKLFGARLVLDMHECTPELFCTKYRVSPRHPAVRLLSWVEQRSLGFADQVITCTPQQRAVFASRGTPPEKIAVVLNAANSAIFRPRTPEPVLWQPEAPQPGSERPGLPGQGSRQRPGNEQGGSGAFVLVAHGLVAQRYGLDTMVRAVALLVHEIPGVVLHIYGKGDYLPEVKALAQQLGVAEQVVAHGFVPEEELLDGIAKAHVGVIAAKRDNFRDLTHTQKMFEYVAMRKPVVIAETSAIRTHFDDSCFQFFASDDPAGLACALRDLYYNPARALAMVESASRRYRAYTWDAQRHVYCEAVLGIDSQVLQPAPVRIASQESIGDVTSADLRPVPVEAMLALSSMDIVPNDAHVRDWQSVAGGVSRSAPGADNSGPHESSGWHGARMDLSEIIMPETELGM